MTLYTNGVGYYHKCTDTPSRVSWCYKKEKDYLHCVYSKCKFRFPSMLAIKHRLFHYENKSYLNLPDNCTYPLLLKKLEDYPKIEV